MPPKIEFATPEEEAEIQRGIAADPDSPEWTDEDFARAKPAAAVMPEFMAERARERESEPEGSLGQASDDDAT